MPVPLASIVRPAAGPELSPPRRHAGASPAARQARVTGSRSWLRSRAGLLAWLLAGVAILSSCGDRPHTAAYPPARHAGPVAAFHAHVEAVAARGDGSERPEAATGTRGSADEPAASGPAAFEALLADLDALPARLAWGREREAFWSGWRREPALLAGRAERAKVQAGGLGAPGEERRR
jgi:hypothetical protein